jgi:hypothetical protein
MQFGRAFCATRIYLTPDEMRLFAHRAAHSGRHVTHFVQDAALAYLAHPPEGFVPAIHPEATERINASLPRATMRELTEMAGGRARVPLLLRDAVLRYLGQPKDHPSAYQII